MKSSRFIFAVAAMVAISRIPAFAMSQTSLADPNVVLLTPAQINLVIPSVIGPSMVERHPQLDVQVIFVAEKLLKAGPLYAVRAGRGVALVPQNRNSLKKAVFVPFDNNDTLFSPKTIPLAKQLAGKLAASLEAGNLFSARMILNGCFDKNWGKEQFGKEQATEARGFFQGNTLRDLKKMRKFQVVSKVRDVKKLPAPLRAYLAKQKNRVVYAYAGSGKKFYAVFSSKSDNWGARGLLFGPNGDRLGPVKTRATLDAWEQDELRNFRKVAGYTKDGGFPTFPGDEPW